MPQYLSEQGDIVRMNFNPQAGHEQVGFRPALIVSNSSFRRYTRLAIVCPITNQIKNYPPHVKLDDRTERRVDDIAEGFGYTNESKFSAAFKKIMGDPPGIMKGVQVLGAAPSF